MKHYIVVLVPRPEGGWRAHFPDFPGCRADGKSLETAVAASGSAAAHMARDRQRRGEAIPAAQSYEEVRHHSNGWAAERGIDWTTAVVSLIPVGVLE